MTDRKGVIWMAKFDYRSVNPRTISSMTNRAVRQAYSAARSILRKRNERLEARGITPVYPTPPAVKDLPESMLKSELAWTSAALRSPVSMLSGKLSKNEKTARTLTSHGFNIPPDKMDDFGRFMEATRKRQGETYKGKSGIAAQAYTELVKTGVSGKTIERSFKKWLEDSEKLNDLVTAAQQAKDTHPNKRVTAAELKQIMKDFG